jgi:hypothetical protein
MSLFRFTSDEYDKMFIRRPDADVQYLRNRFSQQGYNLVHDYVNRDGLMYTRKDVRIMIRFLLQYFLIGNNEEQNDMFCKDANNNIASLNYIVIECFNFRN